MSFALSAGIHKLSNGQNPFQKTPIRNGFTDLTTRSSLTNDDKSGERRILAPQNYLKQGATPAHIDGFIIRTFKEDLSPTEMLSRLRTLRDKIGQSRFDGALETVKNKHPEIRDYSSIDSNNTKDKSAANSIVDILAPKTPIFSRSDSSSSTDSYLGYNQFRGTISHVIIPTSTETVASSESPSVRYYQFGANVGV